MRLAYMLQVSPAKGATYTLQFSDRAVADETAQRLVTAFGGHAKLYQVSHLHDYWHRDTRPTTRPTDTDLVA